MKSSIRKFDVYKIPGITGSIPKDILASGRFVEIYPYLEPLAKAVELPSLRYYRSFVIRFRRFISRFTFVDNRHTCDKVRWMDRGVWYVYSWGEPCWVIINRSLLEASMEPSVIARVVKAPL